MYAYGQSKLANILHASELAKRLKVQVNFLEKTNFTSSGWYAVIIV